MRTAACLVLLALTPPLPAADPPFDPAGRARALAPWIEEETFALVRIDLTRTDLGGLAKALPTLLPARKGDPTDLAGRLQVFTKAGATEMTLSFSTEDLPGISFASLPLAEGADVPSLTGLLKRHSPAGWVVERRGSALVAGPREALERLAKGKPSARVELPAAVKAAGDTAVQVLLLPTPDHRRVVDETLKVPVPGATARVLTRGVRWAALGLDVGAKPRAELTLQSVDAAAARKLADLIAAGMDLAAGRKFEGEATTLKLLRPKEVETAARALKPNVTGAQVKVRLASPEAVAALATLVETSEERSGGRKGSATDTNFKQIVQAMYNYSDKHGTFPPHAIYGKAGKPLLSWRVALLPYLGETKLYEQFRLDEPWDGEHNKKLIDRMPAVFRDPKIKDPRPGLTTYLAPVHKEFVFTGTKAGVPLKEIHDGTANTVVVVDVNDKAGVLWTRPDDLVVSKKDPWKGLAGHYPGFILVGFADASGATRIVRKVKPATIWALFTRAGGETLSSEVR